MSQLLRRWTAADLLEWLTWCLLIAVAASLPILYFVVELQFQRGTLANMAASRAFAVTQRITANPKLWQFEEARLKELVERVVMPGDEGDRRVILDAGGGVVTQNREQRSLDAPVIAERAPLHDAARIVGWLQVERSLRPLAWRTAWLALLAATIAAVMIGLIRRLPLRALRRVEAELQHKAYHDDLTNLYNRDAFRRLLDTAIERAARQGQCLGVLFIDLDRFKSINDTLGHDAGDEVLRAVATRLSASVRGTDVVARLSGDEFAIIVDGLASDVEAGLLADALLARFEAPFEVRGRQWHLSCSVGLSLFPQHARESDKLLAYADTAMLHAKGNGRSARSLYNDNMQESVARRVLIEDDLRGALGRNEFVLHYQPLLDLASGRMRGTEALLRWQCPGRGLVPPIEFIPVLEEMGLIHAVGEWVLTEACRQMHEWLAADLPLQSIAVNVSALQFSRGSDFVEQVRCALERSRLPARHLELELTEGVLMSDSERSLGVLGELSALGVTLAVDDFGTGYSSLSYLRSFPVSTLKIDRSFVRDMCSDLKDASIVRAVIQMAHSLGLSVTAEGIETAQQLTALTGLGCDTGQGYLLGRPMTAAALLQRHVDETTAA